MYHDTDHHGFCHRFTVVDGPTGERFKIRFGENGKVWTDTFPVNMRKTHLEDACSVKK